MAHSASLLGPRRDGVSRGDIAVHDHVCGVYDSREDQYEPACQFIKVGLERGEQCLYIAERLTSNEFLALAEASGIDVGRATRDGSLQVVAGQEVRSLLGGFTPDAMFAFLSGRETSAVAAGFPALRLCADMAWLKNANISPLAFFSYESALTLLLAERNILALCQYAMDEFASELMIAAAETHPLLVYNSVACDNFYFIPPEEYLQPRFADTKLKRLLFNIVSRERLMHNFLTA